MNKSVLYSLWSRKVIGYRFISQILYSKANDISPCLIDTFGRRHNYLRISLTERCNFRCQYCMPEDGVTLTPKTKLLSTDEVIKLVNLFVQLGVNKVRFTGGEPLIRKDLTEIIGTVSSIKGLHTIAMTTNGLALKWKIHELKEAGLNALNISLDTLVPSKFEFITRNRGLNNVMKSINAALDIGFNPVKVNCVVIKDFNEDELTSFVRMTENQNLDIRFIEYSPFGGNDWKTNKMVPYKAMLNIIQEIYPDLERIKDLPNDTAKAYKVPGFKGQIGFITSMSENFCSSCNRLRVTADGSLKVCLFGNEELSLRDALREGHSEQEMIAIIATAVLSKKKQHAGFIYIPSNLVLLLKESSTRNSHKIGHFKKSIVTLADWLCIFSYKNKDSMLTTNHIHISTMSSKNRAAYFSPHTFYVKDSNANIIDILSVSETRQSKFYTNCWNICLDYDRKLNTSYKNTFVTKKLSRSGLVVLTDTVSEQLFRKINASVPQQITSNSLSTFCSEYNCGHSKLVHDRYKNISASSCELNEIDYNKLEMVDVSCMNNPVSSTLTHADDEGKLMMMDVNCMNNPVSSTLTHADDEGKLMMVDVSCMNNPVSSTLTHTDDTGKLMMVDVSRKNITERTAEAEATVHLGPEAFRQLKQNKIAKGDVLTTARIAGISAAKKTCDLIPLCHQVRLDHVDLKGTLVDSEHSLVIRGHVKTSDRTGVEMEALTAVTVAALTVYDMCKSVSKDIQIVSVRLLSKKGGRSDYILQ